TSRLVRARPATTPSEPSVASSARRSVVAPCRSLIGGPAGTDRLALRRRDVSYARRAGRPKWPGGRDVGGPADCSGRGCLGRSAFLEVRLNADVGWALTDEERLLRATAREFA